MNPRDLSIKDFTYHLPEHRIAHYPLTERDVSRLLVYRSGKLEEDIYRNIAGYLPSGSLLLFNNTKVVEARLLFQKPTGATVEIFCLEPDKQYPDISSAMMQQGKVWWRCLVGGASKWKPGQVLEKKIIYNSVEIKLEAKYISKEADGFKIELSWSPTHLSFAEMLHLAGAIPLPPYIKRAVEVSDAERYQTIYAKPEGSVAAPTAGLHFTTTVFDQLEKSGIEKDFVTLHVGAGTFKPVKSTNMHEHEMHAEFIEVSSSLIKRIISKPDQVIVVVGTTTLRTVESLYWMGLKVWQNPAITVEEIALSQWEPYELKDERLPAVKALGALLSWMKEHELTRLITRTRILIAPGYKFRIINGLVTNFHQPQSTLLLLVAALIGDDWRRLYDYALENKFRFLSYGDGCLIWIDRGE